MVLANVAVAGDRQLKALIVGTWTDHWCDGNASTVVFQSDGKHIIDGEDVGRWDVQGGKFIEIRAHGITPVTCSILFLTKREFLAREDGHDEPYMFLMRPVPEP